MRSHYAAQSDKKAGLEGFVQETTFPAWLILPLISVADEKPDKTSLQWFLCSPPASDDIS